MVKRDRQAASIARRTLAGGIDAMLVIVAYAIPIAVVVRRAPVGARLQTSVDRLRPFFEDRRIEWSQRIAVPAAKVLLRGAPGPGARLAGIHRADAKSGGRPTLSSIVIEQLLSFALTCAVHRIKRPHRERTRARRREIVERMEALKQSRSDDPTAWREHIDELEQFQGPSCAHAMVRPLLLVIAQPLTALWSTRRQTLIERASGIVWVRTGG